MIFSSTEFFLFLGIILLGAAWSRGENTRRNLFLAGSYFFYGWWDWRFCFLILAATLIDYAVGRRLEIEKTAAKRKRLLVISLMANLGILGFFKYTNFFIDSLRPICKLLV